MVPPLSFASSRTSDCVGAVFRRPRHLTMYEDRTTMGLHHWQSRSSLDCEKHSRHLVLVSSYASVRRLVCIGSIVRANLERDQGGYLIACTVHKFYYQGCDTGSILPTNTIYFVTQRPDFCFFTLHFDVEHSLSIRENLHAGMFYQVFAVT
jgi:hypothetical protein